MNEFSYYNIFKGIALKAFSQPTKTSKIRKAKKKKKKTLPKRTVKQRKK